MKQSEVIMADSSDGMQSYPYCARLCMVQPRALATVISYTYGTEPVYRGFSNQQESNSLTKLAIP